MRKIIVFGLFVFSVLPVKVFCNYPSYLFDIKEFAVGRTIYDPVVEALVPAEIEDPELLGINKEPAHATLMVYGNMEEAIKANRHASFFCAAVGDPGRLFYYYRR